MSERTGLLSWFIVIILVIMLTVIMVGFIYLQGEISDLKSSNSTHPSASPTPRPTPVLTVTPTPQATQTTPIPGSTTIITSGNTALTCSGSLSVADVSSGEELLIYATITNVGNATAYNVNLRIQSYYPDGSTALDYVKTLDAGNYPQIPPSAGYSNPVNLTPGQSYSIPPRGQYDGLPDGLRADFLANYTLKAVWSNSPTS